MRETVIAPLGHAVTRAAAFGMVAALCLLATDAAAQSRNESAMRRIGYVSSGHPSTPDKDPFRQGLRDAGYVEGTNIAIEARFARGRQEIIPALVDEVLRQDIEVLVVVSTRTALAAKEAAPPVPIVFASVFDPVSAGLVASLARPGGNITGSAMGVGDGFGSKWVELLREAVPGIQHAAVLWSSANRSSSQSANEIAAAARRLALKLDMYDAGNGAKLDQALTAIGNSPARGMIVAPDPYFNANRQRIVRFAAEKRLPAVYFFKSFAETGGLMAYGADNADVIRSAARYVDRILKGARPAELPVEQPTRFELVINLRTAKALGLKIPQSLLLRADQVIN